MISDRTNPDFLRTRLREAGAWSKKDLGQHFLVDRHVLEEILQAANLEKGDAVVEIGPGPGVLTCELLHQAGRVVAFEYDPAMVGILRKDFPTLEVIEGDVLQTALSVIKELGVYDVVANIPYQITHPLLRLFLEQGPRPRCLTLLIQKEVGERLAALPGKPGRSYLSVLAQYFAEVQVVCKVPPQSFLPPPKVDSAVVHLEVRESRLLPLPDEGRFLLFVRRFFTQPRKQFKNVYAGIRGIPTSEAAELFAELGWPATVRAQELSVEQWIQLFRKEAS